MVVSRFGADRCDVMAYATINGSVSEDLLPGQEGHVGVTAADNRLFVEAVLYRYPHRHAVARSAGALR